VKKIISLFQRNYETDRRVRDEVVPGAEWVLAGEGVATRKYDGTSCLIEAGRLYRRREVRRGETPPPEFVPASEVDPVTGKQQGWVPVGDGPSDCYHREAFRGDEPDGTYELLGPSVQGNPEGFDRHVLLAHAAAERIAEFPRTFAEIAEALVEMDVEGIVWHHPDGRRVKIKKKDFGLKRKGKA
jgi:hypothetical protein